MKQSILSAKSICKSFAHDGNQVHVLSNVDLEIYKDDFTVIMGPSGSGKSTLLYALSGMDKVTAGDVLYRDESIVAASEKKLAKLRQNEFGFVFQQMHLVSNLTLFENIAVSGYLAKKHSSDRVKTRTQELIKQMGIDHVKNHLPSQVSGGEGQRCAIARAIINEPGLVFADEPTGALNRKNSIEVLDLLSSLNEAGQSILMVTHDIMAAVRASRLIYLDDGKIIDELRLPPYHKEDEKRREAQVNAWLGALEW